MMWQYAMARSQPRKARGASSACALQTAKCCRSGSSELARKIGAMLDGADVKVDVHQAPNVPGLFAAGDCTGGLLQVAKAVHEGAEAGLSALRYVRSKRNAK